MVKLLMIEKSYRSRRLRSSNLMKKCCLLGPPHRGNILLSTWCIRAHLQIPVLRDIPGGQERYQVKSAFCGKSLSIFAMNRLKAELRRLYLPSNPKADDANSDASGLISPEGAVRAMVLELSRPADWNALSVLWQGVQTDLELPAPAIAVSGIDGYQLWFSLSEPVTAAEANRFLESLRLRYLDKIAPGRIDLRPSVDASTLRHIQHAKVVPTLREETDRWSAFIAPDLAAVFSEEPWLDVCPSPDAQADVLCRLVSIKNTDFQTVLVRLSAATKISSSHPTSLTVERSSCTSTTQNNGAQSTRNSLDPKHFLQSVMVDPNIELSLRIEAARALLPYFEI